MDAAMPRKKEIHTSNRKLAAEVTASHKVPKTVYGCTVESHESTRQRVEPSLPKKHEDHIAGKGFTSMTHYNLAHKLILIPQAMKILDAKAAVDKERKNSRQFQHEIWNKSRAQRRLFWKHKEIKRKSTMPH